LNWIETPLLTLSKDDEISDELVVQKPSIEQMSSTLARFGPNKIPRVKREIAETFYSWGTEGAHFLLDEINTNKYGYSDVSVAVMDMSYPNWQKSEQYSTVIQYNQQIPRERTINFLDQYRETVPKEIDL